MWLSHDAGAAEGEQAADRFADHGRTQMADVHLLRGVGRTVVDDPGLAALGRSGGRPGDERVAIGVCDQPRVKRRGLGGEIDETRTGDRHVVSRFYVSGYCGREFFGQRAGVLLPTFGVGEDAVGLKIAVTRVGGAHLGRKGRAINTCGGGGGFQHRVERRGEVERDIHQVNQPTCCARLQA